MNKVITLTALAVAASVSTNLYAQSSESTTELDPIIVSGGISPVSADEFGRSNTIITREQIEDRGYATVQDALEAQPGVSINGDAPSNRQVRIRGGEGNHTLVLINGVRAAAGDSEYYFRGLDTGYIERIEVLRGPQAVPFGTDASSGVINIITTEAGEGLAYGGSVEFGDGDRENAYLTYGDEHSEFSLSVYNLKDDGFDYSGSGGEKDTTRWQSVTTKGQTQVSDQVSAGFSFRFADAHYRFDDNDFAAETEAGYVVDDASKSTAAKERAGSAHLEYRNVDETLAHRLRVDRTTNQNDTVSDSVTEILSYRLQYAADHRSVDSTEQRVSLLVERKEDADSGEVQDRESDSIGLEYNGWLSEALSVQAGVRYDDNEVFSDATSWNIASSYFLDNSWRLHASAGAAVVNPTFFEFTGGGDTALNADLQPEENQGFDVGLEMPVAAINGVIDVTYFQERLTDEIFSDTPFPGPYDYENRAGDSDRRGIELSASASPTASLKLRGSYTYLDAEDSDGDTVIRRPRNELGLGATWQPQGSSTQLSADLRHVRGLYDDQFWVDGKTGARLPDFTVMNFAATQPITSNLELTARMTNAFDEEYSEVWGYATRGRAGFVGLSASW